MKIQALDACCFIKFPPNHLVCSWRLSPPQEVSLHLALSPSFRCLQRDSTKHLFKVLRNTLIPTFISNSSNKSTRKMVRKSRRILFADEGSCNFRRLGRRPSQFPRHN